MKIKVNFKFDEKYLPPRCRKYRTRTVDGQAEVFVKEIDTKKQAGRIRKGCAPLVLFL